MQRSLLLVLTALLLSCSPPPEPRSLLVISADSLRTDRLHLWNPDAAAPTPHLDALAARGHLYRNAWATSPWTAPSMVSLFSGLYPPSHGVAWRDDTTPSGLPTLPRALAEKGHRLGNFSFFSDISYFRNLGLGDAEKGVGHAKLAQTFRGWLGEVPQEQKFFAWVHLLHPHLPYGASGYRSRKLKMHGSSGLEKAQLEGTVPIGTVEFEEGDRERLLELYDQDVAEMDVLLGEILQTLEESGRVDSTYIVFVADHGEELLEDGWVGHASTSIEAKLLPQILRIPMILAGPQIEPAVTEEIAQPVDLYPFLAPRLGLDKPGTLADRPAGFAFFDSSTGGNLTPQDRRGERLQGVTDGRCLLAEHSFPDRDPSRETRPLTDAPCDEDRLAAALEAWREREADRRVAVLTFDHAVALPSGAEIDAYTERLTWLEPVASGRFTYEKTKGLVTFAWEGEGESFGIEYELLGGVLPVRGAFPADQRRMEFGPLPVGFWNDLASYSPARLRVFDPRRQERSAWLRVEIEPI